MLSVRKTRILLWYACLLMFIVILEGSTTLEYSEKRENVILLLGVVVLLTLPAIWLRNAVRCVRRKLEHD